MKNIFKSFFVIAAAALTLAGCQKKEIEQPQDENVGEYMYTFTIDDETRAIIGDSNVEWVEGDRVGMFVGSYKGYAKIDVNTTPKMVVLYSNQAIPAGTMAYAYAPYDDENKQTEPNNVKITLNSIQTGAAVSSMPLAGLPFEVEEEVESGNQEGNGQIKFANLGSVIVFKVFSTDEAFQSETIKSIQFDATRAIAGVGHIDLTAIDIEDEGTLELAMDEEENFVKVNQDTEIAANKEEATPIKMVILPGTFEGTLTVITDAATYTKAIPEREFVRSHTRTFGLDLAKAERTAGVVEIVKTLPYEESFASNMGDFEIENVDVPEGINVWTFDSSYKCMKANGYISGSRYETESMLVSPWIDLTEVASAQVSFSNAYKYVTTPASFFTFWVKTDEEGSEWTEETINTYGAGNFAWGDAVINLTEYVGNKVKVAFKYVSGGTSDDTGTWEVKNFVASKAKIPAGIAYAEDAQSFSVEIGDSFTAPELINPNNLTVTYASDKEEVASVNATTGAVTIGEVAGTATITATFEGNDDYLSATASYTIKVTDPEATGATDILDRAFTGITGTSYSNWTGTGTSGAVYSGNSAGGNGSVQLRSKDNSGIVTTTSGGHVAKVTVTWESHTAAGRTLDVYGKNSAYSSVADLYDSEKQGTLLGSIVNGTSTSLVISGDYTFVGLRSNDSAMYLSEIQIEWANEAPVVTTYLINLNDVENGTIEASLDEAAEGTVVSLTATPAEGYVFGAWNVVDDEDNVIEVTENKFSMPASDVYVSATFIEKTSTGEDVVFDYASLYASVESGSMNLDGKTDTVDGVSIAYAKVSGSNAPQYYYNGTNLRLYNESTMTITAPAGKNIVAVDFGQGTTTWANGKMAANSGEVSDTDKIWTNEAGVSSVVFTITGSFRFTKIVVTIE